MVRNGPLHHSFLSEVEVVFLQVRSPTEAATGIQFCGRDGHAVLIIVGDSYHLAIFEAVDNVFERAEMVQLLV